MLVLAFKVGESARIKLPDGKSIFVQVTRSTTGKSYLGFIADRNVLIDRMDAGGAICKTSPRADLPLIRTILNHDGSFILMHEGQSDSRGCQLQARCVSERSVKSTVTRWIKKYGNAEVIPAPTRKTA